MKLNGCNKMKITEDNITQLKNYWGNRTAKDNIPSEMKITVSDVREWFNGFLNENGKRFKTGKIFYKTKGLTNFNRRVGISYATYYPYLCMDYGRKGFETVRIKSIISENDEIFFNLSKYNLCGDKKISLTDYYNNCNHLTNGCAQSGKHYNMLTLIDNLIDDFKNGGHIYWCAIGLNGTANSIVKVN